MNKLILPSQTVEVNSTVISKAQYKYHKRMLRLEFKNGKSYDYKPVPNHVFEGLRNSESKGKFINRHILPIYFYKLVD